MKTIHISEFSNLIKIDLDINIDLEDKEVEFYGSSYWGADSKEEYEASEQKISDYGDKGEGWCLYTSCDISGYDYWMIQQEEANYISITVQLENETLSEDEFNKMVDAVVKAENYFINELTTHQQ